MLQSLTTIRRGATVVFLTTFYDVNDNVVQPSSAFVNIVFTDLAGETSDTIQVQMAPPALGSGSVQWTALWDSRGSGAGGVSWSIHTSGDPTHSVEDGEFALLANAANLPTFP